MRVGAAVSHIFVEVCALWGSTRLYLDGWVGFQRSLLAVGLRGHLSGSLGVV
ncbi:MAG: hypothetical protein KIH01_05810 [Candidatus Freyarchaeota archaeon]|nr:hypothetical protein [Candidatus Jordarchaeia archaeon]